MTTKLVNLTPDPVVLLGTKNDDPATIALPSEGYAHVKKTYVPAGWLYIDGVSVETNSLGYGEVTGLPDPQDGILYIVDPTVVAALPSRNDLASLGPMTLDVTGMIVGYQGLIMSPWEAADAPRTGDPMKYHENRNVFIPENLINYRVPEALRIDLPKIVNTGNKYHPSVFTAIEAAVTMPPRDDTDVAFAEFVRSLTTDDVTRFRLGKPGDLCRLHDALGYATRVYVWLWGCVEKDPMTDAERAALFEETEDHCILYSARDAQLFVFANTKLRRPLLEFAVDGNPYLTVDDLAVLVPLHVVRTHEANFMRFLESSHATPEWVKKLLDHPGCSVALAEWAVSKGYPWADARLASILKGIEIQRSFDAKGPRGPAAPYNSRYAPRDAYKDDEF